MAQRYNFNGAMFEGGDPRTANFARLLCLLVEQGTECMKNCVLSHLPSSEEPSDAPDRDDDEMQPLVQQKRTLSEALLDHKTLFDDLKKKKKINTEVHQQLYPPTGTPVDEAKLDMTCWYVLSRNLAVFKKKVNFAHFENHHLKQRHNLPQHQIIRIRNMRNTLFHQETTHLETATFEQMWAELKMALTKLGAALSVIEEYKTRELDPVKTMTHYIQMREQVYLDLESVYHLEIRKKKILIGLLFLLAAIIVLAAVVSNVIVYFYAKTWSSCIRSMKTHLTDDGAISVIPRSGWEAEKPRGYNPLLNTPLPYAVISHSAVTGRCSTTDDCCNIVQVLQKLSFYKDFDDVAYNYMVGNDGVIYEGRGLYQSSAAKGWNDRIISIGFLGKYVTSNPTDDAIDVANIFLQYLVDQKILQSNFTLYTLCQIRPFPYAPGEGLYKIIQQWHGIGQNNTWSWRPRAGSWCVGDNHTVTGLD